MLSQMAALIMSILLGIRQNQRLLSKMRKKKNFIFRIVFLSPIVLFGLILTLALLPGLIRRFKDISYTKVHAANFIELQHNRNVSKQIIRKLPHNIKNIYLDYNQSHTSIFISFNISSLDFKNFVNANNITMQQKTNKVVVLLSMGTIVSLPKKEYVYYIGQDVIWNNSQLEIVHDGDFCYIYSLGEF